MSEIKIIHKAAGILIRNHAVLVTKPRGKPWYLSPGGKIQTGETPQETVVREIKEELDITVNIDDLKHIGQFEAAAHGEPDARIVLDAYLVPAWSGEPIASSEIEDIAWVDSTTTLPLGSIMQDHILPLLSKQGYSK